MFVTINKDEFSLFQKYIEKECGIAVSDGKEYLIESRLSNLVVTSGCSTFGEFYVKVLSDRKNTYRNKIVDAITTNETSWFRDNSPYIGLEEHILPELIKRLQSKKQSKIRIWSAAASTGQEPYSIAMIISELVNKTPGINISDFEILGTDISSSALFLATAARYDQISMHRGMRSELLNKYFTKLSNIWVLDDKIRKMVTLKKFNLQDSFISFGAFDIILCRNVAIYFSTEFKKDLFERISRSIKPHGFFIIGASENLSGYTERFVMKNYKRSVFYQLK